jgi:Zn-dependent peptidase ImmA (M78 family)
MRLLQCFLLAKHVVHFYNIHTSGDDVKKSTSVENIQRIVERMTRRPVMKYDVDFQGEKVRGNLERYDDRFVIHVRRGQSTEWVRFTVIKELCHALMDKVEEYSPEGVNTLRELTLWGGLQLNADEASEIVRCERLAEIMALELIYPFEYRDEDKLKIQNGSTLRDIASTRGVPATWVDRSHQEQYMNAVREIWRLLPEVTKDSPPPL